MSELLFIKNSHPRETVDWLKSKLTVLQEFSPRLYEVDGAPNDVAVAAKMPDIVAGAAVKQEQSDLSGQEQIAVDAWSMRSEGKSRDFDNLSWGTKGFQGP